MRCKMSDCKSNCRKKARILLMNQILCQADLIRIQRDQSLSMRLWQNLGTGEWWSMLSYAT